MTARTFRLGRTLESLEGLAGFVDDFAEAAGVSAASAMQIQLVVEEAATNVVQHAFASGGSEGSVTLERTGDTVRVELVDDGPAFDPLSAARPDVDAPLMERELGGLGIELIRQMTDRQEYRRADGRNRLVMEKRLAD
ncbi:MAG: ATP-binding protein [Alphaproteobacteria bacterium]